MSPSVTLNFFKYCYYYMPVTNIIYQFVGPTSPHCRIQMTTAMACAHLNKSKTFCLDGKEKFLSENELR